MLKRRIFYLFAVLLIVAFAAGAQAWWENVGEAINPDALVAEATEEGQAEELAKDEDLADDLVEEELAKSEETDDAEETKAEDEVPVTEEPKTEPAKAVAAAESQKEQAAPARSATANRSSQESTPSTQEEEKPAPKPAAEAPPAAPAGQRTTTYENYTVKAGDTLWLISQNQGIPLPELLEANNMTENSPISPGMTLSIPRHQIPQQETPGARYGEMLDWWTEAQYVWPIGTNARIIDFATGKSFMVRRSYGAFHADVEPLTAEDSRVMREIWNGAWSWNTRPVIVEVNGRRLAASANGMPHSIQTITNNNFNGHFCIHFLNSTRHVDNLQQADHQRNVRTAAGRD